MNTKPIEVQVDRGTGWKLLCHLIDTIESLSTTEARLQGEYLKAMAYGYESDDQEPATVRQNLEAKIHETRRQKDAALESAIYLASAWHDAGPSAGLVKDSYPAVVRDAERWRALVTEACVMKDEDANTLLVAQIYDETVEQIPGATPNEQLCIDGESYDEEPGIIGASIAGTDRLNRIVDAWMTKGGAA
jgi:hypothetical protein